MYYSKPIVCKDFRQLACKLNTHIKPDGINLKYFFHIKSINLHAIFLLIFRVSIILVLYICELIYNVPNFMAYDCCTRQITLISNRKVPNNARSITVRTLFLMKQDNIN